MSDRSPSSVLAEVRRLIPLAGHPSQPKDSNEARNAGVRLARLLYEYQHALSVVAKEDDAEEARAAALEPCGEAGPYGLACTRHAFHGGKHTAFHAGSGRKLVWRSESPPQAAQGGSGWQEGVGRVVGSALGEVLRKGLRKR